MEFKLTPLAHQLKIFERSRDEEFFGYLTEMGTGKSAMDIHCSAHVFEQGKIQGWLIIAPKGVYINWPMVEIPAHMPDSANALVAHWSSYMNKTDKRQIEKLFEPHDGLRVLVVNVEALRVTKNPVKKSDAVQLCERFLKTFKCKVTVDESTCIKNPEAMRTKVVCWLGLKGSFRRILAGNPMPNGPLDLYSQFEFLKPGALGFANYFAFRNRFAIMINQKMGRRVFQQVVGFQNTDELSKIMAPHCVILKKTDCLDLPPKMYNVRYVEMSKEQKEAYDDMKNNAMLELTELGDLVTAPLVITKLVKLQQIVCGHVKLDSGEIHEFKDVPRIEMFMDLLKESSEQIGKTVAWANYRHDMTRLRALMDAEFGADTNVSFYGGTSDGDRQDAKTLFQDPDSRVRRFLGNPQSGGMGITLTQGSFVIYFNNTYDSLLREQSEDRCHRIGSQWPVSYYDLITKGTVNEKVYLIVKKKRQLTSEVLVSQWRWLFE